MLNLTDREWRSFYLISNELFYIDNVKTYSNTSELDKKGVLDVVGATSKNNGNVGFLSKKYKDLLCVGNCICLIKTGQGSVGDAVYKANNFVPSNNVCVIRSGWLNRYNGLFIVAEINKQSNRYSYGYIRNTKRIQREKLLLPITADGTPDYTFMEQYIKEREEKFVEKYKTIVSNNYQIGGVLPELNSKEWKVFYIGEIFDSFVVGKSKGLNHLSRSSEGVPYVGATNTNNGVMCYVDSDKNIIQNGNAVGFIKNGNGSAGYSIYKGEKFVATSDVIFAYAKWLNKYIGLFITTASDMSQEKYSHGYKWTRERLVKSSIMLPATADGTPDYEYMEQYARAVMYQKYIKYLEYKN